MPYQGSPTTHQPLARREQTPPSTSCLGNNRCSTGARARVAPRSPGLGAEHGREGVRGLNAQLATVSTEPAAPAIVAARLRRGAAASAHGAVRMARDGSLPPDGRG